MRDSFQNPLWPLSIPGNAFSLNQYSGHVSELYKQDFRGEI